MSKILCVPDVHGRDFWIEPCQNWQGSIVFLGDYHDPYPSQVSKVDSYKNLKQLVEFYEENSSRITCLLGNHDANYLIGHGFADREDVYRYDKVKMLLERLNLKLYYQEDDVLFSHSGILPQWLDFNDLILSDLDNMELNNPALRDISPYRGGYGCEVGGILWGDVREYDSNEHLPNYYQVFGHTQLVKDPIIKNDYACLDTRCCYIINTKTHGIQNWPRNCKKINCFRGQSNLY